MVKLNHLLAEPGMGLKPREMPGEGQREACKGGSAPRAIHAPRYEGTRASSLGEDGEAVSHGSKQPGYLEGSLGGDRLVRAVGNKSQ